MTYFIEANAGLIFFYGIYSLLLRNETDFRKQRFFLLAACACALVFPLIEVSLSSNTPVLGTRIAESIIVLPELLVAETKSIATTTTTDVFIVMYLLVSIIIAVPVILQCLRMYRVVRSAAGSYYNNFYVIEAGNNNPSWSFFKVIFIGQSDSLSPRERDLILRHEMLHGKLLHSIDALLFLSLCLVFWFNPVVWMYRRTMARIHEFEVDMIVASENNSSDYGILLAKTALSSNGFMLTHHFNQSFILKRIDMLNMIKRRVSTWKLSVLAITVAIYFVAVACTEPVSVESIDTTGGVPKSITAQFERMKQNNPGRNFAMKEVTDPNGFYGIPPNTKGLVGLLSSPETGRAWIVTEHIDTSAEVFAVVDDTATPKNGFTAFYEELAGKLVYPDQARKMGVAGKVFIEFVVMEDGHLTDFKVVKGIGAGCDTEAVRALTKMDSWKPGVFAGKFVRQKLVLPVTFKLD